MQSTINPSVPAELPKKIHFVWVGGPIKKEYLKSIIKLAHVAEQSGFTVNLWVDDKKNFETTSQQLVQETGAGGAELFKTKTHFGITIRHIDELNARMQSDPFWQAEPDKAKLYQSYIDLERVGLKNLGAASDLLRYEILRQEGGDYFDTDTKFFHKISEDEHGTEEFVELNFLSSTLKPAFPPLGIVTAMFGVGSSGREDVEGPVQFFGGNDMIACVPNHPAIVNTIDAVMKEYKKLIQNTWIVTLKQGEVDISLETVDESGKKITIPGGELEGDLLWHEMKSRYGDRADKLGPEETEIIRFRVMDLKRSSDVVTSRILKGSFHVYPTQKGWHTIASSGPGALGLGLAAFWNALADEQKTPENLLKMRLIVDDKARIMGIVATSHSDRTWLQPQSHPSFDDSSVPPDIRRRGFG